MTVYIRNPYNKKGELNDGGTHNIVASSYQPVTQYDNEDNSVTYLSSNISGSGVFVSSYLIVTANHVVKDTNGSFTIDYGPTSAGGTFAKTSTSSATSKGQAVGSIPAKSTIATITASTAFTGPVDGLAAIGAGGNAQIKPALQSATIEGFPGPSVDTDNGKIQILYGGANQTKPIDDVALYKESVDASNAGNGQAWWDPNATLGAGNSGGPLFVTGTDGSSYVVGGLNLANATGPVSATVSNGSLGAGGYLFTAAQVQSLTQAAKAADPAGKQGGWWKTQPDNIFYGSDTSKETLATDDRSDTVVLGQAATDVVGSLGDDTIIAGTTASAEDSLRYSSVAADSTLTKTDLKEIASVSLTADFGTSSYGEMKALLKDKTGSLSEQAISGISNVTLSSGNDTITLKNTPVQVASNDPGLQLPSAPQSSTPLAIDGGGGKNTFNIDYGAGGTGKLLLESGSKSGTFNLSNAQDASCTVMWGGGGPTTFNISTDGKSSVDVVCVSMSGLTESNFMSLDVDKLQSYFKTLSPTAEDIFIVNPTSADTLSFNGKVVSAPTGFGLTQVRSQFVGDVETQSGQGVEPTTYQLSTGDGGPLIEGYSGLDRGQAPNEYRDRAYVTGAEAPANSSFVFQFDNRTGMGSTQGIDIVSRSAPVLVSTSTSTSNTSSTASSFDYLLDVDPAQHIGGGFTSDQLGPTRDSFGNLTGYNVQQGSAAPDVQYLTQSIDTTSRLNLLDMPTDGFGIQFGANGEGPAAIDQETLYKVDAWQSSHIEYWGNGQSDIVDPIAPDLGQSTILQQSGTPSGQTVALSGSDYFNSSPSLATLNATDYLHDAGTSQQASGLNRMIQAMAAMDPQSGAASLIAPSVSHGSDLQLAAAHS